MHFPSALQPVYQNRVFTELSGAIFISKKIYVCGDWVDNNAWDYKAFQYLLLSLGVSLNCFFVLEEEFILQHL